MPRPLVVIGSGEHARVVAEAAASRADAWHVKGFVERTGHSAERQPEHGLIGDDEALMADMAATPSDERPWLVLGVGHPTDAASREAIVARYAGLTRWATVIHATAWVSPAASVGPGAVVLAGAVVGPGAQLGEHCVVNTAAVVEHDVRMADYVQLGPGAIIGGAVVIGRGAFVGLGASVRDHTTIGSAAIVGMGSVVVGDVDEGSRVAGSPARPLEAGR